MQDTQLHIANGVVSSWFSAAPQLVRENPKATFLLGACSLGLLAFFLRRTNGFSFDFTKGIFSAKGNNTSANSSYSNARGNVDSTAIGENPTADSSHSVSHTGSVSATAVDSRTSLDLVGAVNSLKGGSSPPRP